MSNKYEQIIHKYEVKINDELVSNKLERNGYIPVSEYIAIKFSRDENKIYVAQFYTVEGEVNCNDGKIMLVSRVNINVILALDKGIQLHDGPMTIAGIIMELINA